MFLWCFLQRYKDLAVLAWIQMDESCIRDKGRDLWKISIQQKRLGSHLGVHRGKCWRNFNFSARGINKHNAPDWSRRKGKLHADGQQAQAFTEEKLLKCACFCSIRLTKRWHAKTIHLSIGIFLQQWICSIKHRTYRKRFTEHRKMKKVTEI